MVPDVIKPVKGGHVSGALLAAACLLPMLLSAAVPQASAAQAYRLRLHNIHTHQRLNIVYRRGDAYSPQALARLDDFLRDYRTGLVHHYDPRVFDLLEDITRSLGRPAAEIGVICGYRTPRTNHYLRLHTAGVAEHSLHMQGMAIDIRVPGVKTLALRDAALALHRGGVGYYPASAFVHVDVGRPRQWSLRPVNTGAHPIRPVKPAEAS